MLHDETMIDLTALSALIAVDRSGSVHGAASELGFTPSAVSQQIKRLERQLGTPLLERAGRGVLLTAAGRHAVDEGLALTERVESLRARLHGADAHPSGTIRFGAFSTAARGIVPALMHRMRVAHPRLHITVAELEPWDAVADVASGRLDVALVHHWEGVGLALPSRLESATVLRDIADVLVPATHPLAARSCVQPADLYGDTWACTPEGTSCFEWFNHMFRGQTPPRIDFRCVEFQSQVELVRAGLAVALVPRLGRGELPHGVVAVPVENPVPARRADLIWRASMRDAPAVRAIRDGVAAAE